jgi:hypothetical protein
VTFLPFSFPVPNSSFLLQTHTQHKKRGYLKVEIFLTTSVKTTGFGKQSYLYPVENQACCRAIPWPVLFLLESLLGEPSMSEAYPAKLMSCSNISHLHDGRSDAPFWCNVETVHKSSGR